ncbi:MAG: hypothetical protein RLZZ244_3151 [Verrucomicrobiota bacterium]|jgi:AraC family transcriptional regulator of arabinose operon
MIIATGVSEQEPGTSWERHAGFPYWTAAFWRSGTSKIEFRQGTFLRRARSGILIPPNTPYKGSTLQREDQVWMLFEPRPALAAALPNPSEPQRITHVRFPEDASWQLLLNGLEELVRWWNAHPPQVSLAENALEKVLLLTLWIRDPLQQTTQDERIERVTNFIRENLHTPLSVETLARVASLSPSRLAHLFRERISLTPMQYIELRRIERARQLLLTTNLQIKDVAASTGFSSPEHFSVRFRKATSQSPLAFRQKPKRRHGELLPREDW